MKERKGLRIAAGLVSCVIGFLLARATPYRENTFMIGAGGCHMVTDVFDKGNDEVPGFVIVFHGLAANKKIMSYLAGAFAAQNLRVFVPDLPGHGRTHGPFSFSRAETCAESFVHELIDRQAIDPTRTILVGHSMGAAIADRLAARIPVAGVIAISPAPMSTRHGIAGYLLPFENAPPASVKTMVINGSWEPASIRDTAHDLNDNGPAAAASKYVEVPHATHVSLIFDPRVARASQDWAGQILGLARDAAPASRLPIAGSFLGLAGIFLLVGPFIRETVAPGGLNPRSTSKQTETPPQNPAPTIAPVSWPQFGRAVMETLLACAIAIALLHFWNPLSFVRLFDGGYFATFLLVAGFVLLALRYKSAPLLWSNPNAKTLVATAVAALLLLFLVSAWLEATLTEAWLTWSRWARFPALLIAALTYLGAEELLLRAAGGGALVRNAFALVLRFIGWLAILFAIFVFHRGPIMLFLLAPGFTLFCFLQLAAVQLVRTETRSPTGAALFGAILLAGFCLVIFPIT